MKEKLLRVLADLVRRPADARNWSEVELALAKAQPGPEAEMLKAAVASARGKPDEAETILATACAQYPTALEVWITRVNLAFGRKQYQRADELLEQCLRHSPKYAVLTAPEGNGWIVRQLAGQLGERLLQRALCRAIAFTPLQREAGDSLRQHALPACDVDDLRAAFVAAQALVQQKMRCDRKRRDDDECHEVRRREDTRRKLLGHRQASIEESQHHTLLGRAKDPAHLNHADQSLRRGKVARHTEIMISRNQRCAGSASKRGCHIADTAIAGVRTGSSNHRSPAIAD